jgi:glycyl-tRNA synthetase beta chain
VTSDLLVEIGTEELPALKVFLAATALRDGLAAKLAEAGLLEGWSPAGRPVLGTPRRLAAFLPGVKERQEDRQERLWGPPVAAAFDRDGKPTKAGEGFSRSAGVAPGAMGRGEKVPGKPPYLFADRVVKGRTAAEVIAEALPEVAKALPFKRTMRWPQSDMPFARPIRNLVVLLGSEVVPCRMAGVEAGRTTRGHPFLRPKPFAIPRADLAEYEALLRKAKVVVDCGKRAKEIERQVRKARAEVLGTPRGPWEAPDDDLLREVTGLVEWPRALVGAFEERYRDLPPALLVTAMSHHLRYFPVLEADGAVRDRFVSVTDREERHADGIRRGNERVLRARLFDAAFFFANDRKRKLADFRPGLANVDFHRGLGTLLDKSERVRRISVSLCDTLGLPPEVRAQADRAAFLLKCDLLTEVVKEFPELQGQVGAHYARLDGEPDPVAKAIHGQYLPAGYRLAGVVQDKESGDVPAIVYLAEKADTLASYFSIGEGPTGSADPFGLRRSALGLLDVLDLKGWPVSVKAVLDTGLRERNAAEDVRKALLNFVSERANQKARLDGFVDFVDTVNSYVDTPYFEVALGLRALKDFSGMPEWRDLVSLVERAGNMAERSSTPSDQRLLPEEAKGVVAGLFEASKAAQNLGSRLHDQFALTYLRALGKPVNTLFEKVLVDDPAKREQSAAIKHLLHEVYALFADRLGDLRKLGSGAKPPRA